jgi:hypothetical protein
MANNAANTLVAVTGSFYVDLTNASAAPTDTSTALAVGFIDLGYVSEDGVTLSLPDAGDTTPIKAWQNGATVRILRSPSEDSPQLKLTLIETKSDVIKTVFGTTVTQAAAEGSFLINSTITRTPFKSVLHVIDGAELIRIYAPATVVSSVGEITFANQEAIGYEVTLDLQYDSTLAGNAKTFMTRIKTGN